MLLVTSRKRLRTRRRDARRKATGELARQLGRASGRGAVTRLLCGVQGKACEGRRSDDEAASGWVRLVMHSAEIPGQCALAPYLSRPRLGRVPLPRK